MVNLDQPWLTVREGRAPLVLSFPHTGRDLPEAHIERFTSPWLARRDADWWIDQLYDFAASELDATTVHTAMSRTVVDVNRDPSGMSLYPGQTTTELCPLHTFDGEALYKPGQEPSEQEIASRQAEFHSPYHAALAEQVARLRKLHPRVLVYDCHAIRSNLPRLFDGELPVMNIGTYGGRSCDPRLESLVADVCATSGFSSVLNGRFKGGWITRSVGQPSQGVHAVQMELAFRGYLNEPTVSLQPGNWPTPYIEQRAAELKGTLRVLLSRMLDWLASEDQQTK